MTTFDHSVRCCICGVDHGAPTNIAGTRQPRDGDVSLCFACGSWLIFDQHAVGGCRRPGIDEIAQLENDERSRQLIDAWHAWHAAKGKH